jgi:glycosyltransferase involved in cell wall biosynthesis
MKVVIFGIGNIYEKYKRYVDKSTIILLIDNNECRHGTTVDGFIVKSPISIMCEDYDYIILMSTYIDEMTKQLLDYGIPEEKIKTYKDIYGLYEIPIMVNGDDEQFKLNDWIKHHERKILVVSHAMERSGVPVALMLKKQGWNVVYSSLAEGKLSEELKDNHIEYMDNAEWMLYSCDKFADLIRGFDIIIVGAIVLVDVVKKLIPSGVPIIFWLHESLKELFECYALPNECRNLYYYGGGARVTRRFHEYYPNGKMEELLYFLPDIKPYERCIHEKLTFGLVGRFERRKAQDVFIEAFERIPDGKKDGTEVFMVCPGYDAANDDLKEKVSSIPQIHVLKELTQGELKEFYKVIDILVCPSRDDPMPIVVTEAMQNKIPCIVSDQVGQSVYFKNNYGGYIFESENTRELAELLVYCIDNREDVLKKGDEAFNIFQSMFSEEIMQRNLNSIIDKILN